MHGAHDFAKVVVCGKDDGRTASGMNAEQWKWKYNDTHDGVSEYRDEVWSG